MTRAPIFTALRKALAHSLLGFCLSTVYAAVLAAQCANPTPIPDQTTSSGAVTFSDANALTAATVQIQGSATVTFFAANCIRLGPEFHASGTSTTPFHAYLASPNPTVSQNFDGRRVGLKSTGVH